MKITHATKRIQLPIKNKMHVLYITRHQFGYLSRGSNFGYGYVPGNQLEMILTGLKKKSHYFFLYFTLDFTLLRFYCRSQYMDSKLIRVFRQK